ncbi:MAG: sigma-54-dependent Fis family transcriptional regulator [Thauera phenolivorans]|uniref:Sigma-54-dependent Fis family transcriptional regulator n=1 Tax=Thauera phenolivorans TaxID=1792543 RepID=A0A7X7R7N2_9RHOO|nr:sigma-54-dependent Fis family transcriptional regulator [Thauera phenolivorans]
MGERKVVLVDPGGRIGADLLALELPRWRFQVVDSLAAAQKALSQAMPQIGLIVFDRKRPLPTDELEALLARHDTEWLALFEEGFEAAARLPSRLLRSFHDFHSSPFDRDRLEVMLGHAWGKLQLLHQNGPPVAIEASYGMVGQSAPMRQLYRKIAKIVAVDAPVLIGGESGSGKELVARAIHRYSGRADGPFIAMNCGGISPSLIHSELFGYERGAFTGASQRKVGNIEAASCGVLFLDEIGDLPLEMQSSLLRVLQDRTITRVGGTERVQVDVRVIAATHVDLVRAVAEGRFREDLLYRLNVVGLKLPALRERVEDIPLLAQQMFEECRSKGSPVRGFSSAAMSALMAHSWPGNVRELRNRIHHALVMSDHRLLTPEDLGLAEAASAEPPTLEALRASVERELIETSLKKCRNNVSATARQLGVSRVTLYRMIDRLKIVL